MLEINVPKLCQEYYRGFDDTDFGNTAVPDDINVNTMKIKVKNQSMQWHDMSQPSMNVPHKVNVGQKSSSSQQSAAYGQIQTTTDADDVIKITIETGVVKGLAKTLKLPLKGTNKEVIAYFGDYLEIDPSKSSEIKNKAKLRASLEQDIGPAGATATVQVKRKHYKGIFECKVVLKGLSIVRTQTGARQDDISTVIEGLRSRHQRQPQHDDLMSLTVGNEEIEFTMKGEVEFSWGYDQTIELKDKA